MAKRILGVILSVFILINICGCVALFAGGVAGGLGTASWLSGKLVQRVDYPLDKTIKASREALRSLGFSVSSKENLNKGFAQIRSSYTNGEKIWIDIFRISDITSQIQVRVGTFTSNKDAADEVLKLIIQNL